MLWRESDAMLSNGCISPGFMPKEYVCITSMEPVRPAHSFQGRMLMCTPTRCGLTYMFFTPVTALAIFATVPFTEPDFGRQPHVGLQNLSVVQVTHYLLNDDASYDARWYYPSLLNTSVYLDLGRTLVFETHDDINRHFAPHRQTQLPCKWNKAKLCKAYVSIEAIAAARVAQLDTLQILHHSLDHDPFPTNKSEIIDLRAYMYQHRVGDGVELDGLYADINMTVPCKSHSWLVRVPWGLTWGPPWALKEILVCTPVRGVSLWMMSMTGYTFFTVFAVTLCCSVWCMRFRCKIKQCGYISLDPVQRSKDVI